METAVHQCIIDIETTGLPDCERLLSGDFINYQNFSQFDSCRLVQLSWIILDTNLNELERQLYIVKPRDFFISPLSTLKSHGITQKHAMERGVDFSDIIDKLELALSKCSLLIGYNLDFSKNVLMSELFRRSPYTTMITKVGSMDEYCLMMRGKELLGLFKAPSRRDLVKTFLSHDESTETKLGSCAALFKVFNRPS